MAGNSTSKKSPDGCSNGNRPRFERVDGLEHLLEDDQKLADFVAYCNRIGREAEQRKRRTSKVFFANGEDLKDNGVDEIAGEIVEEIMKSSADPDKFIPKNG